MKKIIALLLCAFALVEARAVPAAPWPVPVTQPDGSTLTTRLLGDEYYNYRTTLDGYTIVRNAQGFYAYAQKAADNSLMASAIVAHDALKRDAAEVAYVATLQKNLTDAPAINAAKTKRQARVAALASSSKAPVFDYSKFRGLVILAQFNDCKFSRTDIQDFYDKMLNQENYTGYANEDGSENRYGAITGSVRDYFNDNSQGKFVPQFDVIGPVDIDYSVDYAQGTSRIYPVVRAAVEACKGMADFTKYDADNDGNVDMFFIIFAGVTPSTGVESAQNHVWPHASYTNVTLDGMRFGRYACSDEFLTTGLLDGPGTIIHEFSHVLGLPDLYDTDYATSGQSVTPGTWEVMSGGSYNNLGRTPAGYSAYDRYASGFITPEVINTAGEYTLANLQSSGQAYRLNTDNEKEFFLLENRQRTRWDAAVVGHGMIIARVDSTNETVWRNNRVNASPSHLYYELVRAGNQATANDDDHASDPFPGTLGITMITNTTTPNLTTWDGLRNKFVLTAISESDGFVTFNVSSEENIFTAVEDFENMPTSTSGNEDNVKGVFARWNFARCNVVEPGAGYCDGEKSVAMSRGTAFTMTTNFNEGLYMVAFTAINSSTSAAKFRMSYSYDDGATWTYAAPVGGTDDGYTVAAGATVTSNWAVSNNGQPIRFRLAQVSGGTNRKVYIDNFTLYTTNKFSGVESVLAAKAGELSVSTQGDALVATTASAQPVRVYAVNGTLVGQAVPANGQARIQLPSRGFYVAVQGSTSCKVVY